MDEKEYEKYINLVAIGNSGNKYKIVKYISEGGNGYVFECMNEKNEIFVLKLLHTLKSDKIRNFKKEIELQKEIKSKYIVKCIDSGDIIPKRGTKPRPFYIMEKYDSTLEDLINKNLITPLKAYNYSIQLCEALKAIHKKNPSIIHRDLKPENILYDSKSDRILICDFGLSHITNNGKSINEGFVGNIDYHAPEQKKRGKQNVGTYTDIYSLGLIINVLFTKEIPQGESFKKIWQCAPYFSFIDDIVARMISHDIKNRESDVNAILIDLKRHEFEYDVKESFFKNMYKKRELPANKVSKLMDLFALLEFSIKHNLDWEKINLNYYCDYHFKCDEKLKNSIFINILYTKVIEKFEYEGRCDYEYKPIDLTLDDNKKVFDSFNASLQSLIVFDEIKNQKNLVRKYLSSICDYHVREFISSVEDIKKKVNYYCDDAPILYISYFINKNLSKFKEWNYWIPTYILFDKYEESDVSNKMSFYYDPDNEINNFCQRLKVIFPGLTYMIKNHKVEVSFDTLEEQEKFKSFLNEIANKCEKDDVRKMDILDIITDSEDLGVYSIYKIDVADCSFINDKM